MTLLRRRLRLARPDALDLIGADHDRSGNADELRLEANALRHRLDEAASLFAARALTASQLQTISSEVRSRPLAVERQQAEEGRGSVLAEILRAPDRKVVWDALPLSRKRAVTDTLMTITVIPLGKGV